MVFYESREKSRIPTRLFSWVSSLVETFKNEILEKSSPDVIKKDPSSLGWAPFIFSFLLLPYM